MLIILVFLVSLLHKITKVIKTYFFCAKNHNINHSIKLEKMKLVTKRRSSSIVRPLSGHAKMHTTPNNKTIFFCMLT